MVMAVQAHQQHGHQGGEAQAVGAGLLRRQVKSWLGPKRRGRQGNGGSQRGQRRVVGQHGDLPEHVGDSFGEPPRGHRPLAEHGELAGVG